MLLDRLRNSQQSFSGDVRSDIASIIRLFDRVCDRLSGTHDTQEVNALWELLQAQIEAIYHAQGFRTNPRAVGIRKHLRQAVEDVKSFISGKLHLPAPAGVLTQDGINLGTTVDLRPRLKLGIGFLYNLDFCGKHRLSLTVARDSIIFDEHSEALAGHISSIAGEFLGRWFREEGISREEVSDYLRSIPLPLAETVKGAYDEH